MSNCLIDANVFVAAALEDDTQHSVAKRIFKEFFHQRLITNYLIAGEVATVVLINSRDLAFTQKIIDDLFFSDQALISVSSISAELWQATHDVFVEQKNHKLSWADCSLIAQARLEDVQTIATLDQDLSKEFGREFKFIQE